MDVLSVPPPEVSSGVSKAKLQNGLPMEVDYRSETSSEQTKASKFKVVKLESKAPYCRGRWQCFDFHDRPKDTTKEKAPSAEPSQTSISSIPPPSATSSTSEQGNTVEPSTIPAKPSKFKVTAVQLPPNTPAIAPPVEGLKAAPAQNGNGNGAQTSPNTLRTSQTSSESSTLSSSSLQSNSTLPTLTQELPQQISDSHAALSAELSRRTAADLVAVGSEEAASISLNQKIRQCMDLVGNHLIIAVREELSQVSGELAKLREKVEQLEFENGALRSENIILRSSAGTDSASTRTLPNRRR